MRRESSQNNMEQNGKVMISLLPITFLPVISYFILGPLEVYLGNAKDFAFNTADFFPIFCILGILIGFALSLLGKICSKKLRRVYTAVILGFGICSYLQAMFMNVKLSEVNGGAMEWNELSFFTAVNLLIWIGVFTIVFIALFILKDKWDVYSSILAMILCAVQIVAVVSLLATESPKKDEQSYQLVGDQQFEVASEENIIVFVLDTYGNMRLEQVIEAYPDAVNGLHDFEYYNNADCQFYCTFPSMTHLFTGIDLDFNMNSLEWLEKAWKSDRAERFFDQIRKGGFSTYLYSGDIGYVYGKESNLVGKFDNIVQTKMMIDRKKMIHLLSKISAYRYVPYILKPYFEVLTYEFQDILSYTEHDMPIDNNARFYDELKRRKLTVAPENKKAIIVQHLFGIHEPYQMTAEGEPTEESTPIEVGRGLHHILDEYFEQMRSLGVYDNSTIIVMADHGAWYGGDTQPIFFIKRKNQTSQELRINKAPIAFDDFQATILKTINEYSDDFGKSIDDWTEKDVRTREVYMRGNDETYPAVPGSAFNVYYKYVYTGNRETLNKLVDEGQCEILSATPW